MGRRKKPENFEHDSDGPILCPDYPRCRRCINYGKCSMCGTPVCVWICGGDHPEDELLCVACRKVVSE